jgi:hypothetical protein
MLKTIATEKQLMMIKGVGWEAGNPTVWCQSFAKLLYFYFYKKNESKIYSYIILKNNIENMLQYYFWSCVINQLY